MKQFLFIILSLLIILQLSAAKPEPIHLWYDQSELDGSPIISLAFNKIPQDLQIEDVLRIFFPQGSKMIVDYTGVSCYMKNPLRPKPIYSFSRQIVSSKRAGSGIDYIDLTFDTEFPREEVGYLSLTCYGIELDQQLYKQYIDESFTNSLFINNNRYQYQVISLEQSKVNGYCSRYTCHDFKLDT